MYPFTTMPGQALSIGPVCTHIHTQGVAIYITRVSMTPLSDAVEEGCTAVI